MHRRQYLGSVAAAAAVGLAGCLAGFPGTADDPGAGSETADAPATGKRATLRAGEYSLELRAPRVRASVLDGGTHVDVRAEAGAQFLVVDARTGGAALDEIPVSAVADGSTVATDLTFVGRADSERAAPVAFAVPVEDYSSAGLVLESDGESARWTLPDGVVTALGRAPSFGVESLDVPETVRHGDSFEASFTVANEGDRDARFLAEFGHGQISDTGEVELTVPAGARRSHSRQIEPYYGSDPDVVPVVLDWGIDRRRVEVSVEGG